MFWKGMESTVEQRTIRKLTRTRKKVVGHKEVHSGIEFSSVSLQRSWSSIRIYGQAHMACLKEKS